MAATPPHSSVAIKQLSEGVIVLLERGVPSAALVAMTADGTEPDNRASRPVAFIIDATGEAAAIVARCSIAPVTRRVPLRRSPRWRQMQIHDYRVCRRDEGSFIGSACTDPAHRPTKGRIDQPGITHSWSSTAPRATPCASKMSTERAFERQPMSGADRLGRIHLWRRDLVPGARRALSRQGWHRAQRHQRERPSCHVRGDRAEALSGAEDRATASVPHRPSGP